MNTGIIIAVCVISGVFFLIFMIRLIFILIRKRLESYIQINFDKKKIIGATTNANFLGVLSKGSGQIRGNGALVLTRDQICILRAVPFKEYCIPIKTVTDVSLENTFNKKFIGSKLLQIQYHTRSGPDAAGLALKNPEKWHSAIEKLIS